MGLKENLEYDPAKKPEANSNIQEEMSSRLKLEVMYLKKQLADKENDIIEMNKKIGHYNKQIVDRDRYIERLTNEFQTKERELIKKMDSIKQLIEPELSTEKSSVWVKVLNYFGIKVSYI